MELEYEGGEGDDGVGEYFGDGKGDGVACCYLSQLSSWSSVDLCLSDSLIARVTLSAPSLSPASPA